MIKVYLNRKVSETQLTIGNQYESGVNAIDFDLSELKQKWPNGNIYLLVSRKKHTWPYSIDDGEFKIEYVLTWKRGFYQMNVVVTDEKITDQLESSNTIFVSDTFNAYVNENQINAKALTEQELPRELQIVYDDLITLKKNIEKDLADGKYIGPQGPKGEPGDVTEEYRNLASQIAQNASDAQASATSAQESAVNASQSATNAQVSATNAQKILDDTKEFANQTKKELNQIKADTNTLNEEANTSAVNAKASEDKAKEYADNLKESTDAISQNTKAISELADKKITKFYASNQGETHVSDSDNGKIMDMMIYGKSSQDGTPSVENPVEIKSVVNPTVKVTNEDGLKVQSVTLNNITLNAIPVSIGGNVTMDGQQYAADYIDVEKGKLYRKVKRVDLKDVDVTTMGIGFHANGNGYLSLSIKEASEDVVIKDVAPMSNNYIGSRWTDKSGYVYIPSARSIIFVDKRFTDKETAIGLTKDTYIIYVLQTLVEEDLTSEQIQALKELATYYHVTNISVNSEQLDGYTVFNYPISMANGWNYVKQQLNDNRDYIYDMDVQSAEAYVNSEYAVTLIELEV